MRNGHRKYYLLNYVFILGLLTIFLNDHIFKLAFPNWLTGKLSDFAGLLILPMLLSYFFPKWIKANIYFSGIFFIFWKSGYSQPFIDIYNQLAPIKITRIVDYTDLIALSILPLSYLCMRTISNKGNMTSFTFSRLHPVILLFPTALIFMSTSPPHYYYYTASDGNLICHKCSETVKFSKTEILGMLEKNNYKVSIDTLALERRRIDYYWIDSLEQLLPHYPYYKIERIVIEKDTIRDFQFSLEQISDHKTKIWINGMNIPKDIPDKKVERKLRKYYRNLIKKHIQQSIAENNG